MAAARRRRADTPTAWQVLVDLQGHSIDLRAAHRLIRAHIRAAEHRGRRLSKRKSK